MFSRSITGERESGILQNASWKQKQQSTNDMLQHELP